jgi:ATP-binding cassette subfamily C exporter for protease/lipase
MNDFRTVREFLHSPVLLALMESPVSLVCLVLLFAISPVLGWASVVGALVQGLVGWANERSTQPPLMAANRSAIMAQQYADGSLRNAEVIESMGMLRDIHRRWMEKQREFLGLQALASERAGGYQALTKFIQTLMGSLLLGLGAWLLLHNQLNAGRRHDDHWLDPWWPRAGAAGGHRHAVAHGGELPRRLGTAGRPAGRDAGPAPGMPLPAPRGLLQVEQLVAGAPGNPNAILRGVAFSLQPGEVLAVVGPSASGKTTLARLLVGLWPAAAGKVRLDGADVFSWDKSELGPHVGYLPQGVELFDGTVAENIARFGPVEKAKVESAARAVGLHEFILALPQGYDTRSAATARSCRAASASAWRWRARCMATRSMWCWTNPTPAWTRRVTPRWPPPCWN